MEKIEEIDHGGMPMVVWLVGDAGEFVLSAEEVMTELHIRRSRLTQISGRELRVGRMRVDRYVRPFYRPVDVQEYKETTRAAMTRQRSAAVVDAAATDIEERHKNSLAKSEKQIINALNVELRRVRKTLSDLQISSDHLRKDETREQTIVLLEKLTRVLGNLNKNLLSNFTDVAEKKVNELVQALSVKTAKEIASVREYLLTLRNYVQQGFAEERAVWEEHGTKLAHVQTSLTEFASNVQKSLTELSASDAQARTKHEAEIKTMVAVLREECAKMAQAFAKREQRVVVPRRRKRRARHWASSLS